MCVKAIFSEDIVPIVQKPTAIITNQHNITTCPGNHRRNLEAAIVETMYAEIANRTSKNTYGRRILSTNTVHMNQHVVFVLGIIDHDLDYRTDHIRTISNS